MDDLTIAGHIDEEDLVRQIDGALADADAAVINQHLAGCLHCRERSGQLAQWSTEWSRVLQSADSSVTLPALPVARRRHVHRGWKIAASIALITSLGAAVSPLRAWLIHGVRDAWFALTRPAHREAVLPVSSSVSLRPTGGSFEIAVPGSGIESRVTVDVVAGDSVAAVAFGTGARILVLPGGLQLVTGGEYALHVPSRLERVIVTRNGRVARTITPVRAGEHWELVFQRDTSRN